MKKILLLLRNFLLSFILSLAIKLTIMINSILNLLSLFVFIRLSLMETRTLVPNSLIKPYLYRGTCDCG